MFGLGTGDMMIYTVYTMNFQQVDTTVQFIIALCLYYRLLQWQTMLRNTEQGFFVAILDLLDFSIYVMKYLKLSGI